MAVRILVIDKNPLFAQGLARLFEGTGFVVGATAPDAAAAVAGIAADGRCDIVLVDIDAEGDSAISALRVAAPDVKIAVMATAAQDVGHLARCFEAGADAYLLKSISPDALKQSFQLMLLGEKVFPTRLAALLVSQRQDGGRVFGTPDPQPTAQDLTERELEILHLLLNGHPNKVMARKLGLTEAAVKAHLKGLLRKINAVNRTQAAIWALNNGLSGQGSLPRA